MVGIVIPVMVGIAVGIAFITLFSVVSTKPSFYESNISECTGYLCKYQQKVVWNEITKNADCRDTQCAFDNMLHCKSVTVAALFGDGNNATIIRVYRANWQPGNGTTMCWIDLIKPKLLKYTHSCLPCDYYMDLKMINANIGTSEMASWHVKSYDELVARLTYHEPGNRFGGSGGPLPMSQFFTHKAYE